MEPETHSHITVGELIKMLQAFHPDNNISFGDGLHFNQIKTRGEKLTSIEFKEFLENETATHLMYRKCEH